MKRLFAACLAFCLAMAMFSPAWAGSGYPGEIAKIVALGPGATVMGAVKDSYGINVLISYAKEKPVAELADYYRAALEKKNWTLVQELFSGPKDNQSVNLDFTNGKKILSVTIVPDVDETCTSLTLANQ